MYRWLDEDELEKRLQGPLSAKALAQIMDWVRGQRSAPDLVSSKAAAKMLDVHPPYITKLKGEGRLPEGIPVEDGREVFLREEIELVAADFRAMRERREKRREDETSGDEAA